MWLNIFSFEQQSMTFYLTVYTFHNSRHPCLTIPDNTPGVDILFTLLSSFYSATGMTNILLSCPFH